MQNILVTGGCGFIGSHITLELLTKGYNVTVLDSNINSSKNVIGRIKELSLLSNSNNIGNLFFVKGDIRDEMKLYDLFSRRTFGNPIINSVIHLAGLKSVKESILNPLDYWDVNVKGVINLLNTMIENNCFSMVFSSSATVYGHPEIVPIIEDFDTKPINPYGRTKLTVENILNDLCSSHSVNLKVVNLRYFNPIGAHSSGVLGENPKYYSDNIFPNILNVALRKEKILKIFGNNWPTPDGTTIRDFIHVMDIAEGHIAALEYIKGKKAINLSLNLGTGLKTTILELIKAFEKTNRIKIPYKFVEQRAGDTPKLLSDNSLAKEILNWEAKRTIYDMCKDGWNYAKRNFKIIE